MERIRQEAQGRGELVIDQERDWRLLRPARRGHRR
jgi:hypothetical protein